jgi:hypothetical protein
VRLLVLAAALTFIVGMGWLTTLQFADNGVTLLGVIGVIVLLVCAIGVLGAFLQPPRR